MTDRLHRKFQVLIADDTEEDRFLLRCAIGNHAPHFEVAGEVDSGDRLVHLSPARANTRTAMNIPFPTSSSWICGCPARTASKCWNGSNPTTSRI